MVRDRLIDDSKLSLSSYAGCGNGFFPFHIESLLEGLGLLTRICEAEEE